MRESYSGHWSLGLRRLDAPLEGLVHLVVALLGARALGAPEALEPQLATALDHSLDVHADRWRDEGPRVVLLARHPDATMLTDRGLPTVMQALCGPAPFVTRCAASDIT